MCANTNNLKDYACSMCNDTFISGWSDEDAQAEYQENFGDLDLDHSDTAVVCDDCYNRFMAVKLVELSRETLSDGTIRKTVSVEFPVNVIGLSLTDDTVSEVKAHLATPTTDHMAELEANVGDTHNSECNGWIELTKDSLEA